MFSKITLFLIAFTLLTACAAPQTPSLPVGEGTGVRETPPPTETSAPSPIPTETLAPTPEAAATATPEAETITFLRSGVEEVTMLKKDTITFNLSNGETITMPKIQMAGVEPGYNVDKLVEKALEFIVADGVTWGVFRQPSINYGSSDPYTIFKENFLLIDGFNPVNSRSVVVPNDETIPAKDRFEVGVAGVDGQVKGVILGYFGDNTKKYRMQIFLVNADAEGVRMWLRSNEIKIPSRPDQ